MSAKNIDDILGVTSTDEKEDTKDVVSENEEAKADDLVEMKSKENKTEKKKSTSTKGNKQTTKSKESDQTKKTEIADTSDDQQITKEESSSGCAEERLVDVEQEEQKPSSAEAVQQSEILSYPVSDVTNINDSADSANLLTVQDLNNSSVEETVYPIRIFPRRPVAIYRGPNVSLRIKDFGGSMYVLGEPDKNGFSPVSFVRSEFGRSRGYIRLSKEVIKKCSH